VSDNLRKGAALNAVQIAECLINRKLISAKQKAGVDDADHPEGRNHATIVSRRGPAASAMIAPASAQTPALADLPAALRPAGLSVYLEVLAAGVQIYTCGKNDAGAFAWSFKAPEATLFDTAKTQIGKHYGGPHLGKRWAGGKVVGAVKATAPGAEGAISLAAAQHQIERGIGRVQSGQGNPARIDQRRRRAGPGLR